MAPPLALIHGASWLTREGELLRVPGFHEAWIEAHQELVPGCRNVSDVVLRMGWISVAVYKEGYVELLVPDRRDPRVRELILELLGGNRGLWRNALVMAMDEEGYSTLKPEDFDKTGRFEEILGGSV